MKVSGRRCRCSGCGQLFNSVGSFDGHRTGPYAAGRRCLTTEEMMARGWSRNQGGYWITGAMPEEVTTARAACLGEQA